MAQYAFPPNNGEVAVLIDSESGSESDHITPVLDSLEDTFQYPVGENVPCMHPNSSVTPPHSEVIPVYQGLDPLHATATALPQNIENAEKDELVRNEVLNTCSQLLVMLEDVKLSVLHLQYSLHAGDLRPSYVEEIDRSNRLWAWDTLPPLGDTSPPLGDTLPPLGDDLYKEILEDSGLSQDTLPKIQIFGVTSIETPLDADLDPHIDPHVDTNFDNVCDDSELYDGAAAKGCF